MSVFHLKYRPQTLGELDLPDVALNLKKILENKNRPQAFLFCGPKGSGKTSAARIAAKMFNCEKLVKGEPCNKCSNCLEITVGNSLDVLEIDAASNRGIDEIRELKNKIFLLPTKLRVKVIIIDEVHMLTKEAFNALLKMIEEPPVHVVFILCTTDPQKVPETVLSRLTKIEFRKANLNERVKSLARIVEGEGIKVDKKILEMVALKSDGSLRNLQRGFNEMILVLGENLTEDKVMEYLAKKSGDYSGEELDKNLADGDLKTIISRIEKMASEGVDIKQFREKIIEYFQNKLLVEMGVIEGEKAKLSFAKLKIWLQLLITAAKQEKEVSIDQLPLELAVIELLGDIQPPIKISLEKPSEKEKGGRMDEPEDNSLATVNLETIEAEWMRLLVAVKPYNHSVEAFLRAARPIKITGKTITFEVFYPFHKDKLEEPKNREVVEKGIFDVWGTRLQFKCVLGKSKKPAVVISNDTPMESVAPDESKKDIYDVAKEIFG